MRRRFTQAATVLSILICIALTVMWVRSYWRYDAIDYWSAHPNARQMLVGLTSDGGHIVFGLDTRSCENSPPLEARRYLLPNGLHRSSGPASDLWQRFQDPIFQSRSALGIAYVWQFPIRGSPIVITNIGCSYAWPLLLAALLPVTRGVWISLRSVRRQNRRRHNRCEVCNYSLVHNTSGVCPECGTLLPTTAGGIT